MRHGGVVIADDAVYHLVERSIAAAGVQPDLLAGLRRLPRQRPALTGCTRNEQFIA